MTEIKNGLFINHHVKPQMPWKPTRSDRLKSLLLVALSALITILIIQSTPLKGKLAYFLLFVSLATLINSVVSGFRSGKKAISDSFISSLAITAAVIVFMPVASILSKTIIEGSKGFHKSLFTDTMAKASITDPISMGGILHSIIGTILLVALASIISVPLSIMTALYLTEIKGRASTFIQFIVQAMSGIPSIVSGIFIYAAILVNTSLRGSAVIGALALSILMIPTVTRTSQEVLKLIPNELREAGLALGATQWKTVSLIVIPAARSGLVTAFILGVARIAGETAPLLFTIGASDVLNLNPFNGANSALPYYTWRALTGGTPESMQRAWTAILVLLIIVLALFTTARSISRRRIS